MIVDLFAGPGGWSQALRDLGSEDVGIEKDRAALGTRAGAGFRSIAADVTTVDPSRLVAVDGLIASPPCQDWSESNRKNASGLEGLRGSLVTEVPRWADALRPRWIACEQVPGVLPVWQAYAAFLEDLGYRAAVAVLNAADFGVPQTRRRAILVARLDDGPLLPEPTHAAEVEGSLFPLAPWVTMAEALEDLAPFSVRWDEGAPYLEGDDLPTWCKERPSTTVTSAGRVPRPGWRAHDERQFGAETVRLTPEQAARLQSFPDGFPFRPPRVHEQIGNAIPPLLARAILAPLLGS